MLSLTRIIQNVLMAERKTLDLHRLSHLQVYEENRGHPCFIDKETDIQTSYCLVHAAF